MNRPESSPTILALKKVPRRKDYLLALSDGTELKVTEDDVPGFSLAVGSDMPEAARAELAARYEYARSMEAALRLLKIRPRTEGEIRRSLRTRGWVGATADRVVQALVASGQVDDRIFARLWATEKFRGGSTGRRRVIAELRAKMVDPAVAEEETGAVYVLESEAELARELARRRASRMGGLSADSRRRRLYGHLLRRGFEPEIAAQAAQSALRAQEDEKGDHEI